jgi:hypothetical protein
MKIPDRLRYFFTPPPLWIIQLGGDELIFSHVTKRGITEQEQLFLTPQTVLLNKIANPSSLCRGLNLFCSQKKLPKIRAWFLLPKEFYPDQLLPHELFQFLVSIKKTSIIPIGVITNPLGTPTQLAQNIMPSINSANNYLTMFSYYNPLHPAWWVIGTLAAALTITGIGISLNDRYQPINLPKITQRPTSTSIQLPQKATSTPARSPLHTTHQILSTAAALISPTIVLDKLAAATPTQAQTNRTITISGITTNISDLTNLVTNLNDTLGLSCNLSQIKELPTPPTSNKSKITPYRFSIIIST